MAEGFNAGRIFATLGAILDRDGFQKYDRAVAAAEGKTAKARLGADVDDTGFNKFKARVVDAGKQKATATLGADVNESGFTRFFRRLADADGARAQAHLDVETRAAEAKLAAFEQRIHAAQKEVEEKRRLDVDTTMAETKLKLLEQRARSIREDIARQKLRLDVDIKYDEPTFRNLGRSLKQSEGDLNRLNLAFGRAGGGGSLLARAWSLLKWPSYITGIGLASQALSSLAGGAVGAASSLGPLVGLIPAAGAAATAAAQGFGTLALAVAGIGGAIKAGFAPQTAAAKSASTALNDAHAKAEAVRSASLGVAAANRDLDQANRQVRFSQEDVTQAYRDATRSLTDLKTASEDAKLAQEDANLALLEAEQNLRDVRADDSNGPLEVARAELTVKEARQKVKDQDVDTTRAETDYHRARAQTVNHMPQVVQAERALADSRRGQQDATRAVEEAVHQLHEAQRSQTAQTDKASTAVDQYAQKMKSLPPAAQAFVKQIVALKPAVDALRGDAASGLFPGLSRGITDAMRNFPILRRIVGDTAKEFGHLGEETGKLLGSKGFGRDLQIQGERNVRWIDRAGQVAFSLEHAFRNLAIAAGPLVDWLTRLAVRQADLIEKSTTAGRENGKLAAFFRETRHVAHDLFTMLGDLGGALVNIGKIGYRSIGRDMLDDLTKVTGKFKEWTDSAKGQNAIKQYFLDAKPGIYELSRLIRDTVKTFLDLGRGDQVAPLLKTIRTDLLPAFKDLVERTTAAFGPAALDALKQFIILFSKLGGPGGPLVDLVKLLGTLAGALNSLIDSFPALGSVLTSMIALGGIAKALQITAALTGMTRLIGLLRTARAVAVGGAAATAAGGGGGLLSRILPAAAGGAAGVGGGAAAGATSAATRAAATATAAAAVEAAATSTEKGMLARWLPRMLKLGPRLGGPIGIAIGTALSIGLSDGGAPKKVVQTFEGMSEQIVKSSQVAADAINALTHGHKTLDVGTVVIDLTKFTPQQREALRRLAELKRNVDLFNRAAHVHVTLDDLSIPAGKVKLNLDGLRRQFSDLAKGAGGSMRGLDDYLSRTIDHISRVFKDGSASWSSAMNKAFASAVAGISKDLASGAVKADVGTRAIVRVVDRQMKLMKGSFADQSEEAQRALTGNIGEGIDAMRRRMERGVGNADTNMRALSRLVRKNMQLAKGDMTQLSEEARINLARNFSSAAGAVKDQMDAAGKTTEAGLKKIRELMRAELKVYGITGHKADLYLSGKDPLTGKPMNDAPGDPSRGKARGGYSHTDDQGHADQAFARGGTPGGVIGKWGERGRDMVRIVVGRGEAILNGSQQKIVNAALRFSGMASGGLPELFSRVRTPHHLTGHETGGLAGLPRFAGGGFLQLPKNFKSDHDTLGLPGYPAKDIFAPAGTRVGSPIAGILSRFTGHPPSAGAVQGAGGPFGWSIYLTGEGRTYFLTHFGSRSGHVGDRVRYGADIGTVGNYPGRAPHIHEGLHMGVDAAGSGPSGATGDYTAAPAVNARMTKAVGVRGGGAFGALANAALGRMDEFADKRLQQISGSADPFGGDVGGGGNNKQNEELARRMMDRVWSDDQWPALKNIWTNESNFDTTVHYGGGHGYVPGLAYGIPQSKPGDKMASAGKDWQTNPVTQIKWGLGYIKDRYGDPANAWRWWQAHKSYEGGGFADDPVYYADGGYADPLEYAAGGSTFRADNPPAGTESDEHGVRHYTPKYYRQKFGPTDYHGWWLWRQHGSRHPGRDKGRRTALQAMKIYFEGSGQRLDANAFHAKWAEGYEREGGGFATWNADDGAGEYFAGGGHASGLGSGLSHSAGPTIAGRNGLANHGKAKSKSSSGKLSAKFTNNLKSIKSPVEGVVDWIAGLEQGYANAERYFTVYDPITDDYVIDPVVDPVTGAVTPGRIDTDKLEHKIEQLNTLIAIRDEIMRAYITAIEITLAAIKHLKTQVLFIRLAWKAASGKERDNYKTQIDDYETAIGDYEGSIPKLVQGGLDSWFDKGELINERDALWAGASQAVDEANASAGAGGPSLPSEPPPADTPSDPGTPPDPTGDPGVDPGTGTGGDTGGSGSTGPTPDQIATEARAQLAAFNQNRADLFGSFGSNYVAAGMPFAVDETTSAAGARYFGGGGPGYTVAGAQGGGGWPAGPGAGQLPGDARWQAPYRSPFSGDGGSPVIGTLNQHFDGPPPDEHSWTRGIEYELAARTAG